MTDKNSSDAAHKSRAEIFKWSVILIIFLGILGYAIYSKVPFKTIKVGSSGVEVEFGVQPIDQKQSPTQYSQVEANAPEGSSNISMLVPGEGAMPLSSIDAILIESGPDDFQNRHLGLVRKALDAQQMDIKYEEPDEAGIFAIWISHLEVTNNRLLINYQTRLIDKSGKISLAMREAYKEGDVWQTRISESLKAMLRQTEAPRFKPVVEVFELLQKAKPSLIDGTMDAGSLINKCFVNGTFTQQLMDQYDRDKLVPAYQIGLSDSLAYRIAEFGYQLFLDREYRGSQTFWRALITLLPDPYFYTMLGACDENLGDIEAAKQNYRNATILDPEYEMALSNLKRIETEYP